MTESKKFGAFGFGHKKWKRKGFKPRKERQKTILNGNKRKLGKQAGKQNENMNYFNCGKLGL